MVTLAQQLGSCLRRGGLTLLELLIVLMIVAAIVLIALPTLQPSTSESRIEFAKTQLRYLWNQENAFYTKYGRYATFPELAADPELSKTFEQRFKLEQPVVSEVKFTGPKAGSILLELTAVLPDGTGYLIDSRGEIRQYQTATLDATGAVPGS
jgi:prepilin-type N-terminal cleavage/methylation domain-containing protein